jgi:glucose-6-phosphate 1-epimerase
MSEWIAEGIQRCEGPGGLPCVRVSGPGALALISLQGAQVLEFGSVLWLSPTSHFKVGKSIRGGVPLCWPWFGPPITDTSLPQHGFARNLLWRLEAARRDVDQSAILSLELQDSTESQKLWPHAFHLRLQIRLGDAMDLELHVENTGTQAWDQQAAFHPYLRTPDVTRCHVSGLGGLDYFEKREGKGLGRQEDAALGLEGGLDRIYFDSPARCAIVHEDGTHFLEIEKEGAKETVVWNPGPDMENPPADLPASQWRDFVCVEALSSRKAEILQPGVSTRMAMRLAPVPS